MRASRVLGLQPTRLLGVRGSPALRMGNTPALGMRASPARKLSTSPMLQLQKGRALLRPMPKEEHSAHTISQRLRSLKKIPIELMPLAFVVFIAVVAGLYSGLKQFWTDKQLRLTRQGSKRH